MLKIRLSRVGKKNHPTFRIIVSEKSKDTKGDFLELLGSYDPHISPARVSVKADRITYWLSKGAQPSSTVHNLLVDQKIITGAKVSVVRAKKKGEEAAAAAQAPATQPADQAAAPAKEEAKPATPPPAGEPEKPAA